MTGTCSGTRSKESREGRNSRSKEGSKGSKGSRKSCYSQGKGRCKSSQASSKNSWWINQAGWGSNGGARWGSDSVELAQPTATTPTTATVIGSPQLDENLEELDFWILIDDLV